MSVATFDILEIRDTASGLLSFVKEAIVQHQEIVFATAEGQVDAEALESQASTLRQLLAWTKMLHDEIRDGVQAAERDAGAGPAEH